MESQQETFREITPKEKNYEKKRKGPVIRVVGKMWALVPRGAEEGNQWYLGTLE